MILGLLESQEYDTACSQDDMLTPPIEPSVKKRLSFNHGDDDVTERLSKRPRFNEYGDVVIIRLRGVY